MNETNTPLVSIRCITYNHEKYIRDTLEGFVMQKTNFKFEAIVHDDASTDNTAAIIQEYAEKYPDIIKPIFETENQYSKHDGSLRKIMNDATHPNAKYIAFCEGDDYWTDPYKLQKQVDIFDKHPNVILCVHKYQDFYEDQKRLGDIQPNIDEDFKFFNIKFYVSREKWITQPLTCMYRNDIKINSHYLKYNNAKDLALFFNLLKNGDGYFLHKNMAIHRIHSGGVWSGANEKIQLLSDYKCIKGIYDIEKDKYSAELMKNLFIKKMPIRFFFKNIKTTYPLIMILIKQFGIVYSIQILIKKVLKEKH